MLPGVTFSIKYSLHHTELYLINMLWCICTPDTFTDLQNVSVQWINCVGTDWAAVICFNNEKTGPLSRWWRSFVSIWSTKPWQRLHASTLDFFFDVRGLADSAGSGEPGGSVGGLGAFSTSPSGSRGREEPSETPENKITQSVTHGNIWPTWVKLLAGVRSLWRSQNRWQPRKSSFTPSSQRRRVYRDVFYCCNFHSSWKGVTSVGVGRTFPTRNRVSGVKHSCKYCLSLNTYKVTAGSWHEPWNCVSGRETCGIWAQERELRNDADICHGCPILPHIVF